LTIFQVITLEGWVKIMYLLGDSTNILFSAIFFISLVLFGSFFILNLILAVIMGKFTEFDAKIKQELREEKQKI
jgi:hypothetical protein